MKQSAIVLSLLACLGLPLDAQQRPSRTEAADRSDAYYHYAMGHLYSELASAYGNRGEYLNQAIDHMRQAMKADPQARFLADELSDLYIQGGRLKEGVLEAEAALRQDPKDLNARRLLGRIYTRLVGDAQAGRINDEMLKRAIEQYSKVVESDPADLESWLNLGRLQKVAQNSVESEKAFRKALDIDAENEDALTGLALVYTDLGDHRRASELLQKVAGKSPNLRTLVNLANSYEQMRDYALAAETYRKALELSEENPDLKRALAQSLLLADKLDESAKLFEELVAEDPKDAQSYLRLSQIYRQKKDYVKAREAISKAKEQEPGNLEVLFNEVGILEAEGKPAEAIAALKSVVDSTARRSYSTGEKANRAILLERLGLMYRSNEQTAEAVAAFRELGALDPSHAARASAQVIDTYRQAKEFDKAREEADAAQKKFPDDRVVTLVRASLLADIGRADEAVRDVKKLLDGKNDRDTYLTLAQLNEKGRNFSEMAKAIDEAEKLSVTNEEKEGIYFMRGAMYEKLKKFDASEAEFRKVLAMNPESASALNYLGYMLADRNVRLNEALEMIKKALEEDPHNGAYLDSLGWVYFRLGRLDEAEENLRLALARASKDPTVNDHLGDVLMKQGKLKDAITQWEAAVKLWQTSAPADIDQNEVTKIQKKLESGRVRLAKEQAGAGAQRQ
jgi:tetratricopeptide (TPR) repeat protein